jgi:2-polyprenyl-3-methyl-5-hydroxy-6-metoxy-1,4-benzoquinol methylase
MLKGAFSGLTTLIFANYIHDMVKRHGVKTLLDYGCGQGVQYGKDMDLAEKWGVDVTKYDPAVPEYDKVPDSMFDMVVCVDVLEHIPEEELKGVIEEIFSKAKKCVFFTVCPRAAKKTLPDGRNCHLTIRPLIWWEHLIKEIAPPHIDYEVMKND